MSEAIQLDDYLDEIRTGSYPSRGVGHKSSGSGGDMDDVLKRLGGVESAVAELRVQVSAIAAIIPTLATKEDLKAVNGKVATIIALVPHFATKADLSTMETKIIKWMIGTVLTAVAVAFTIAKFVH